MHQCVDALQAFTLVLAICLSIGSPKPSAVFSVSLATCCPFNLCSLPHSHPHARALLSPPDSHEANEVREATSFRRACWASTHHAMTSAPALQFVFGTCAAGAVVLTVNVVLLGGNIGFFQSMCLLGYCLFPMDVAAIVTACTTNMIARWIVVLVGCAPSSEVTCY